ncbi:MAG: histidine phosphatase family protein [Holophaga sp.]|nr:histidine phosphatase family protein [Holophaga sp.]
MTTLYLLRHGPTDAAQRGAPLGRLDLPVNAAGQALWPRVKAELLGLGIQRVLCSQLARSRDHARDLGLPCRVLPDLAEQAFGSWDGVPWAEIRGAEAFFKDPVRATPAGGGESFFRCADRARAAIQGTWDGSLVTLVLAHGGPLRAILAHFLGLPLDRALDLAWQPYGLSKLEIYRSQRGILVFHNRALPSPAPSGMLES